MSAAEQVLGGSEIEVVAKAKRRRFTLDYKRKIVHEADRCKTQVRSARWYRLVSQADRVPYGESAVRPAGAGRSLAGSPARRSRASRVRARHGHGRRGVR